MSISLPKGKFTVIGPDEIWKLYNDLHGIFRGGGNSAAPKIFRADGPRRKDLDVRPDPETGLRGSRIPKGLVFNVKDYDHPLLNVSEPMSVIQLTALLTELASMMKPCDVKIDRFGKIIENYPGALKKVVNA